MRLEVNALELVLQQGEHETPPPQVFLATAPDGPPGQDEEVDARERKGPQIDGPAKRHKQHDTRPQEEEWESKDDDPPFGADSPDEELPDPLTKTATAGPDDDRSSDRRAEPAESNQN